MLALKRALTRHPEFGAAQVTVDEIHNPEFPPTVDVLTTEGRRLYRFP